MALLRAFLVLLATLVEREAHQRMTPAYFALVDRFVLARVFLHQMLCAPRGTFVFLGQHRRLLPLVFVRRGHGAAQTRQHQRSVRLGDIKTKQVLSHRTVSSVQQVIRVQG